jgi:antitoxin HicB
MKYHFKIHRDKDGLWAQCIELPGCSTQADSHTKLLENMQEALDLYLQEPDSSSLVIPLPKPSAKGKGVVAVPVNPPIAFALLLRNARLKHQLTQKQAAQRLGMKNLYSYQRLESARTANPALNTIAKIKSIFPELRLDQVV